LTKPEPYGADRRRAPAASLEKVDQLLVDALPIGIIVFEDQTTIRSCNCLARQMLGEMTDTGPLTVAHVLVALRFTGAGPSLNEVLFGSGNVINGFEVAGPHHSRLWVNVARAHSDVSCQTPIVMSMTPMTHESRADVDWNETLEYASHDIRLMLSAARRHLESIPAVEITPNSERRIASAQHCLASSFKLTESLLASMSLERTDAVRMKALSLAEVVGSVCEDAQIGTKDKRIDLRCDLTEAVFVRGNYSLLYRAIFNLVDNATKFSPSGAVVLVSLTFDQKEVKLLISNQGEGFPKEILQSGGKVQLGGIGKHAGFGLGLRFVRQIAKAHDSTLRLRNVSELGAVVEMIFPRQGEYGSVMNLAAAH
jgi:signal transduction histidine kinase